MSIQEDSRRIAREAVDDRDAQAEHDVATLEALANEDRRGPAFLALQIVRAVERLRDAIERPS